jgi:murein DD-endopeptidase MepM/ murein hydrolase activator NlpD
MITARLLHVLPRFIYAVATLAILTAQGSAAALGAQQKEVIDSSIYYFNVSSDCSAATSTVSASGNISPNVGNGLPDATKNRMQQILVAAGQKFNVDPNFIASFYYAENTRTADKTNNGNSASPPPVTGDGKWRDPPPPYGQGPSWPTNEFNTMGAFQFIPQTWASYAVDGNGDGKKDAQDLTDEAFGASKYLAALSAKSGASEAKLRAAAFGYNHSNTYVDSVLNTFKYLSGKDQSTVSASTASCDNSSSGSSGDVGEYKNPLRDIKGLTRLRIDMGVDYGGNGPVYAIGNGKVNLATTTSGWPGGGFVNYKLTDGPAAGKYVYFAENCKPTVRVGDTVSADTVICRMTNGFPYTETGWATEPSQGNLAAAHTVYSEGDVTAYGANFSDFMKKLGAPPGVQAPNKPLKGSLPSGWPTW